MDHKEVELLLFEFASGELDSEMQSKVEMHLSDCPSCQEQIRVIEFIKNMMSERGDSSLEDHLSSDEIASFSLEDSQLPLAQSVKIATHLKYCPTCRHELEISQKSIIEANALEHRCVNLESKVSRWRRVALIAACLLLIVIYPAWRGVFNTPTEESYNGGAVNVLYFYETTRDGADAQQVTISPNQQFLLAMIDEDLEELFDITSSDLVDIKLQSNDSSEILWSWQGAAEEIMDQDNSVISLLVKLPDNIAEMDTLQIVFEANNSAKKPFTVKFVPTQ